MNKRLSPTSASLARSSRTGRTLVSGSLRLLFIAVLLAGMAGLTIAAPAVAAQITAWQSLPNKGLNHYVLALAIDGSDLYLGGYFTALGDGADISDNIARYDTTTDTWHSLPNQGLKQGEVYALALDGSDLYVGGAFTALGDGTDISDFIARYDIATSTWHSLPNQGLKGLVHTLALDGNDLYVGGGFETLGDGTDVGDNIARYDISAGTWYALPNGGLLRSPLGGHVRALALDGNDLYVGGSFETLGDGTDISDHIARYDTSTSTWHSLPNQGLNVQVSALAVDSSDLYVGGTSYTLGDGTDISNCIARFDTSTSTWHSLPNQGLTFGVSALTLDGRDLYVGGHHTTLGDGMDISDCIARFDTSTGTWHSLPNGGLNFGVFALALGDSDLYVGGKFTDLRDGTDISNNIARGVSVRPSIQAPAPIPEASTLLLLGSGLTALGGYVGLRWRVGRKRPE